MVLPLFAIHADQANIRVHLHKLLVLIVHVVHTLPPLEVWRTELLALLLAP
jgi:hypothetical protein